MRRNLRLDWRALALLGALLSIIIAWSDVVFAMPALRTTSNQGTNNTNMNNTSYINNSSINNSNYQLLTSNNSYIQSDHSRNSRLVVLKIEHSIDQNQSISAEFNMRTLNTTIQPTAINTNTSTITTTTTSTTTTPVDSSSSSSSSTTTATTIAYEHQQSDPLGFVFSVAPREHLAILSRTERSIRHQNQHLHHQQLNHRQQQQSPVATATAGNGNSNRNYNNNNNNFIGSKSKRLNNSRNNLHINSSNNNNPNTNSSSNSNNNKNNNNPSSLDRNERSTNPVSEEKKRIVQIYIKNRFLQLLPDGTVSGTQDEQSDYIILLRSSVGTGGHIKIRSVATCLYLCMDACGTVYGSRSFTDDCVFYENMDPSSHNFYSSAYNSNARRTFYLALNRHGAPRRTQISTNRTLGKLSKYTRALSEAVPEQRVDELIVKYFGPIGVNHSMRGRCDDGEVQKLPTHAKHFQSPPQPDCSSSSSGSSNSRSSSSSSSSRRSSSSNSSSNVPADSASSLISISNNSQSDSGHISSNLSSRSSSNNNSNNSNSNSNSNSKNNSNSNSSGNSNGNTGHQKNKNKNPRRCRPHENEEQHNCHRRTAAGAEGAPNSLRKLGPKAMQQCKERRKEAIKKGLTPPICRRKPGAVAAAGAANAAHNLQSGQAAVARGAVARPRGNKKNPAKAGGNNQRPNAGAKKQRAGNANAKRTAAKRQQRLLQTTTTTTTRTITTTTTAAMASSLGTPGDFNRWPSSSPMPALALSETSDRVERNVRMMPMANEHDEDEAAEEEAEEDEFDSVEDGSYEDATLEGHVRGSAGDESVYFDPLDFLQLLLLQLLTMFWLKRSASL